MAVSSSGVPEIQTFNWTGEPVFAGAAAGVTGPAGLQAAVITAMAATSRTPASKLRVLMPILPSPLQTIGVIQRHPIIEP